MLKKFFRKSPLGRTLSLRNKTGKTVASLAIGLVGAKVGVDTQAVSTEVLLLQSLANFSIVEVVMMAVGLILAITVARGIIDKALSKALQEVIEVYVKAVQPNSDGGKKLTQKEKALLFEELIDVIELILERLGIEVDLDGDGE